MQNKLLKDILLPLKKAAISADQMILRVFLRSTSSIRISKIDSHLRSQNFSPKLAIQKRKRQKNQYKCQKNGESLLILCIIKLIISEKIKSYGDRGLLAY